MEAPHVPLYDRRTEEIGLNTPPERVEVKFNFGIPYIRRFTFIRARYEMDGVGRPGLYQAVGEALAQLVSSVVEENPQVLHLPSGASLNILSY